MNWTGWHFGRSFGGAGHLEESCPCPKAPCGLVVYNEWSPNCGQHPPERGKTIRTSHPPEECSCLTEDGTDVDQAVRSATARWMGLETAWSHNGNSLVFSATALALTRRAAAQAHGIPVARGSILQSCIPASVNSSLKLRVRNLSVHKYPEEDMI